MNLCRSSLDIWPLRSTASSVACKLTSDSVPSKAMNLFVSGDAREAGTISFSSDEEATDALLYGVSLCLDTNSIAPASASFSIFSSSWITSGNSAGSCDSDLEEVDVLVAFAGALLNLFTSCSHVGLIAIASISSFVYDF